MHAYIHTCYASTVVCTCRGGSRPLLSRMPAVTRGVFAEPLALGVPVNSRCGRWGLGGTGGACWFCAEAPPPVPSQSWSIVMSDVLESLLVRVPSG